MDYAAPQLRLSTANILTDLGWLAGTFHVPQRQSLMDFLGSGVGVIKCTRVRVPGEETRLPFVAIRRDAVLVIEPTQGDELIETAGSIGRTAPHRIGCLLPAGILTGALDVLVNVRVSDFLRQQPGLALLHDCRLAPYGQSQDAPQTRRLRTAIVNLSRVTGIAEWEGTPG